MLQYLMAVLNFRNEEEGQGLVEYALILVLVAVVVIVSLGAIGTRVDGIFGEILGGLNGGGGA